MKKLLILALLIFGPFANAATGIKINELPQTNNFYDISRFIMEIPEQGTNGAMSVEVTNVISVLKTQNFYYAYPFSTTDFVATNSTVNSNLTVNFMTTATREIFITNNITITNFVGFDVGRNISVKWRIIPVLVNRTVAWPVVGNSFNYSLGTNVGSPLWTTLTNGVTYQVSFDSWNTNVDVTISAFYRQ